MWHLLVQDVDSFWLVKLLCQGVHKNGAESITRKNLHMVSE